MKAIGPALALLCMAGAAQAVEDTDLALGESYAGPALGGSAPRVHVNTDGASATGWVKD